jgi:ribosomal protein L29
MNTNNVEIIPDEHIHLLGELQNLLEQQIGFARQGNVNEIEALSKQASSLVGKIARSGILESSEFNNQREQLRKSYQDLCLTLTTQQAENAKELSHVRKGKKTIATYGGNI